MYHHKNRGGNIVRVSYSIYDAKAKFSEIIRLVRSGTIVAVTHDGELVAEIIPINKEKVSIEEHFKDLERRGILIPVKGKRRPFKAIGKRPGAVKRFIEERSQW